MRSTVLGFCLGSVLFCAPPALAKLARSLGVGSVTDVGPEAGLVWLAMSQPFLFRGQDEVLVTSGRAGVYKSLDGGQSWVRGERAPDIAYLITIQDGISRTADFGESFEPLVLLPNANLSDCAVDPADPAVVYTVAGFDALQTGVLFKSTDAGRTFSRVGAGLETVEGAYQMSVAPTNPQVVYVSDGYTGDLYVSSDGGLNFRLLPNAPAVSLGVYAHPTDDGTLFVVAFNDGLFRSTDGGDSFARAGAGLPAGAGFGLAFHPSDSAVLYPALPTMRTRRSFTPVPPSDRFAPRMPAPRLSQSTPAIGACKSRTSPSMLRAGFWSRRSIPSECFEPSIRPGVIKSSAIRCLEQRLPSCRQWRRRRTTLTCTW